MYFQWYTGMIVSIPAIIEQLENDYRHQSLLGRDSLSDDEEARCVKQEIRTEFRGDCNRRVLFRARSL